MLHMEVLPLWAYAHWIRVHKFCPNKTKIQKKCRKSAVGARARPTERRLLEMSTRVLFQSIIQWYAREQSEKFQSWEKRNLFLWIFICAKPRRESYICGACFCGFYRFIIVEIERCWFYRKWIAERVEFIFVAKSKIYIMLFFLPDNVENGLNGCLWMVNRNCMFLFLLKVSIIIVGEWSKLVRNVDVLL